MSKSAVFGCAGPTLSADEAAFFRRADPWGFILFGRNVTAPPQVRALVDELRNCVGRADAPVLIDQEGGRVARLGPPHWRRYPPARAYAGLAARDPGLGCEMAWLGARLIAHDLRALGISVDCAPVLDVPAAGAHDVVGDRAFGETSAVVALLGRAAAEGLLAGGVLPVIKHIPGHGRAMSDSHHALPIVRAPRGDLEGVDFAPFAELADMPVAMTAHVVFADIDAAAPATLSAKVIGEVVRGAIGFSGLLVSDDLSMRALTGSIAERAASALAAGCDVVLHCNGDLAEMREVAAAAGPLEGRAAARAAAALARVAPAPESFDQEACARRFDAAFEMRFASA
ncbi:MAG TPA: beta-N-acetylhexosaminidase [Caulobacteraceae bacterium]|nr:beta-N-acetylhexosaminidase [Caulobacteraceae bacterium]